jgi:GntR family transcriptional regulator / MocR family aminotransferase
VTQQLNFDPITIDRASEQSLHQQLYERIRSAICDGRLPTGARLPSTRSLAVQLGVARGTVDGVYAHLAGEGYLTPLRYRGTVVTPGLCQLPSASRGAAANTAGSTAERGRAFSEPWLPLQLGLPALDLFPQKPWTRILARQVRQLSASGMISPDPMGLPALREEIAAYLAVSRGIVCTAGQIVVTHGYQDGLNLVADLLLAPGDRVWIEDPGYGYARRTLQAGKMSLVAVPVDDEGLCVDFGRKQAFEARLAVVTPAHQFPLGATLSLARRRELLNWAAQSNSWILEDDYDCEFHYSGQKPAALKALDLENRVIYAGSFSKSLLPSLRLGYLVLPPQIVRSAEQGQALRHRGVGIFEQLAVAEFMKQGYFARHLRRMRGHYKARRNALVLALKRQFGDGIDLVLRPGGLHVLARFPKAVDDVDLANQALEVGLKPSPLSGHCVKHDIGSGLLLSFTNVMERRAGDVAAALFRLVR